MKDFGANLAAQIAATNGLNVSHARALSAAARFADTAGVGRAGANFVAELTAAGRLNTRFADIAGMKDFGANLASEIFEVANLLESAAYSQPELERQAAIEVLAALIALVWCSVWLAGWIQWAAAWGQPITEMDPYGLLGNAILISGSTGWAHGKSRRVLGRFL